MRVLPVALSRESVSEGECVPWCRSQQLYTLTPALSVSLSHSSSNIWQLVFDVDHKTTVSWQMEKCRLYELTQRRGPTRGPPYWISGELQRPFATVGPHKRGLVFSFGDHKTCARPASRAVGRSADCASQYFFIFCLPLFFTLNNPRFFLSYFALLMPTVRTQYSCNGCRLCCCSCSLLCAALSNRAICLFFIFFSLFFLSLSG